MNFQKKLVISIGASIAYIIFSIPMFFILLNVNFLFFLPQYVFIFPFVLPFSIVFPSILKNQVQRTHEALYAATTVDDKLKEEYTEDTRVWLKKTFEDKGNKILNMVFFISFIFIPFYIVNDWELIPSAIFTNALILPYFIIYWLLSAVVILHAFFVVFQCLNVTSMIHHFSFWKVDKSKIQGNPLGDLLSLNILTFVVILILIANQEIFFIFPLFIFLVNSIKGDHYHRNASRWRYARAGLTFLLFIIPFVMVSLQILTNVGQWGLNYPWERDILNISLDIILFLAFLVYYRLIFHGDPQIHENMEKKSPFLTISIPICMIMAGMIVIFPLASHLIEGSVLINPIIIFGIFFHVFQVSAIIIIMIVARKLKKITHDFVAKSLPHLKPDKVEEQKFHFWSTFNSFHAIFFSIAFAVTFSSLVVGISIIRLGDLFLTNQIALLLWQVFNYSLLFIFGMHLGFAVWILFQSLHDFWHSITVMAEVPKEELARGSYNGAVLLKYTLFITVLVFGTAELWFIGDYFAQAAFLLTNPGFLSQFLANMGFRHAFLLTLGSVTFCVFYYLLRREYRKKITSQLSE